MQRKFEELRTALSGFVDQRDHLVLVVHLAGRYDVAYVLKYLEGLEQATRRDVYLTHAAECGNGRAYLDALMTSCQTQIDVGNRVVASGEGERGVPTEPWAPLPRACFDTGSRPRDRVRALVEHVRRYRASVSHRIVIGLLPSELRDPRSYAELVRDLVPTDGFEPWMAGVRLIVRDSQRDPQLVPWLERDRVMGTLIYPIDFGTPAIARGLADDARDPGLPDDDRMNALLQLGGLDHAYGRIDDALDKYGTAYRYFVQTKSSTMQGVCILLAGYALERGARVPEAWERYRQALELGLANTSKQLILNAMVALGGMHQRGQQWEEAGKYWEGASHIAKALSNGFTQCDAMENWGLCLIALGQSERALEIWTVATEIATKWSYWRRVVSVLEHRIEIGRRGSTDVRPLERELEAARRELKQFEHQHPPLQEAPR
jgi:hypothetical protein